MNTCPYCENKNSLVNIGYLLDSGTTNTSTFGLGYNSEEGISPMMLWSNSASNLVSRFSTPRLPGDVTLWNFIGWTLLSAPVIAYMLVTWQSPDFNTYTPDAKLFTYVLSGLPLGLFLGMFAALGLQKIVFYLKKEERRKFEWSYYYLREGTFCNRCGMAFDLYHAGSPEEFVSKKFDYSNYA
jgi:hypothetical protein